MKVKKYKSGGKAGDPKKKAYSKTKSSMPPRKAPKRITPKGAAGMKNKKDVFALEAPAFMDAQSKFLKKNPGNEIGGVRAGEKGVKKARQQKAMEGMVKNKKTSKSLKKSSGNVGTGIKPKRKRRR